VAAISKLDAVSNPSYVGKSSLFCNTSRVTDPQPQNTHLSMRPSQLAARTASDKVVA